MFISFSFGVLFLSASKLCADPLTIIFGMLFVISTPLGVGIMWGIGDEGLRETDPLILIVQGVVCGGLIYLSACDLIAREFQAS